MTVAGPCSLCPAPWGTARSIITLLGPGAEQKPRPRVIIAPGAVRLPRSQPGFLKHRDPGHLGAVPMPVPVTQHGAGRPALPRRRDAAAPGARRRPARVSAVRADSGGRQGAAEGRAGSGRASGSGTGRGTGQEGSAERGGGRRQERSSHGFSGGRQRPRAGGKFRGKEMEEGGCKREGCRDAGESVGQGVLGMSAGEGGSIKLSQQRGAAKTVGASDG